MLIHSTNLFGIGCKQIYKGDSNDIFILYNRCCSSWSDCIFKFLWLYVSFYYKQLEIKASNN